MTLPPADSLPAGPGGQRLIAPGPRRCNCCLKTRTDPAAVERFGLLIDGAGFRWQVCGKCIRTMWRKRHPRPDEM